MALVSLVTAVAWFLRPDPALWGRGACAAALIGWALGRIDVVTHALVTTKLVPWLDRSVTVTHWPPAWVSLPCW